MVEMGSMARISRSLLDGILADMASEPGRERCGLLLGRADWIEDWLPAANVHADSARHFELDPAVLLAAMRVDRSGGGAVIGHVHSHPFGTSEPSLADADAADASGRLWLIVGSCGPRLWRAVAGASYGGAFEPVALSMFDEA
jgi:desampylase